MKRAMLFLFALLILPAAANASGIDFTLSPSSIAVDTFYNGTSLRVDGRVPEGSQVVIRFIGSPGEVRMKEKGKALGLLWMNMNSLRFGNVPKVCLVESSQPLKDLGLAGVKLGLEGLAEGIPVEPASADRKMLLSELLLLKGKEGLFREGSSAVKLGEKHDGMQAFSASLDIPSRLSPGSYTLEIVAVKDGVAQATTSKTVEAKLIGVPALMADLAFNHGAWYGVLASVIAILGGLAIGLVFQSKGAH